MQMKRKPLTKEAEMSDQSILEGFRFFQGLSTEEVSTVTRMSEIKEFQAEETIFQEGRVAENLYGVVDGEVDLFLIFEEKILKTDIKYEESVLSSIETLKNPIVVDTVKSGEIFGWSSLIGPGIFTTTARCISPAKILTLPASRFKKMLYENPQTGIIIMEHIAEIISRRLQSSTLSLIESWGEAFGVYKI